MFSIPAKQFVELAREFAAPMERSQRKDIALHLAALAFKYERVDKQRTSQAVSQILVLLGLVCNVANVMQHPPDASVDVREHVKGMIGASESKRAKVLSAFEPPKKKGVGRATKSKARS